MALVVGLKKTNHLACLLEIQGKREGLVTSPDTKSPNSLS